MNTKRDFLPVKHQAGVCGLFCPACIIYMASQGDEKAIHKAAGIFNIAPEDLRCDGCRTSHRFGYCQTCKMSNCAAEKEIDFCGACEEYPCEELQLFQTAYPHRNELWRNQTRIEKVGYQQWFLEMLDHYACMQCETINSTYHITCHFCGSHPPSKHVNLYHEEIEIFLSRI
jgi:hypothetical protein